jgi:hypothetical protein
MNSQEISAYKSAAELKADSERVSPFSVWKIGDFLVSEKLISASELDEALEEQQDSNVRLGSILVEMGIISEDAIHDALMKKFGIPRVELGGFTPSEGVLSIVSYDMAEKHAILPLFISGNRLFLAMADPLNWHIIDSISDYSGLRVEPVLAFSPEIKEILTVNHLCSDLACTEKTLLGNQILFPDEWCLEHHILPLSITGNQLSLAMSDPSDQNIITIIKYKTKLDIAPFPLSATQIEQVVKLHQERQLAHLAEAQTEIKADRDQRQKHQAQPIENHACGQTINNRFLLVTVLGAGGMGTVYKAVDLRLQEAGEKNCHVALKIINEDFQQHPRAYITMHQEAAKTKQLQHPNIVTVKDLDRDGDMIYIIMEYLEGKALCDVLADDYPDGMSFEVLNPILSDLVEALAFAHQCHIIHCDFKPGNAFLTHDGIVKVIDFGLARSSNVLDEEMQQDNQAIVSGCTPSYASHELYYGEEPEPADDVYALACATYKMLTGEHPYQNLAATEASQQNLKPPRIKSLPQKQWKGLLKGMALEKQNRTSSAAQFLEDIQPGGNMIYYLAGIAVILVSLFVVMR